ncbi:Pre-mRNA-splicing factor dre4 [Pseudocercospora fuligena]|uniref:Pre-mRNA-splicing factor dre4 n=1 Tax=Pseudocercospora fuligena TaxID=685502 RepID=A0A8H6R7U6_9PEZI|nr:Pre-mRNA-splicing factor dre4 [Pseudocercospora fuligena]
MESPNKRQRTSSPTLAANDDDFVPLGGDDEADETWQAANGSTEDQYTPFRPPREPKAHPQQQRRRPYDPRHEKDKPKSKHALPGHEPWILVKTKFRRRFVHNIQTKESFWRIPDDVWPAVREFERWEKEQKEKSDNAKWAEEQLKQMRQQSKAAEVNDSADQEGRSRRRRSESLQREDEEAMMAELAAQAEHAEEEDAKSAAKAVEPLKPQGHDLESDSEYEVVEVTDSEGSEGDEEEPQQSTEKEPQPGQADGPPEDAPVEFGEDDIEWQLAQMGQEYGLDPGEYGEEPEAGWEEGAQGLDLSDEDAVNLFRDLLYDYQISPFTPWEKIIADESETSILNDDRYTVLPNMKARREVFDAWARDRAAELKAERAAMEKLDPKIPYLAFLQEKATPKLYWPEFKRKPRKALSRPHKQAEAAGKHTQGGPAGAFEELASEGLEPRYAT